MLTVEKLKNMKPGEIFATGLGVDDGKTFNIWGEGHSLQWVAVRGKGYHDWAIYYHIINPEAMKEAEENRELINYLYHSDWDIEMIARSGDKLTNEKTIKAIVPCDEESFKLYRY